MAVVCQTFVVRRAGNHFAPSSPKEFQRIGYALALEISRMLLAGSGWVRFPRFRTDAPSTPNQATPSSSARFGRPHVETKQVVGILSQGNQFGAYVMGISTAKTLLSASDEHDLERIFTTAPLIQAIHAWKEHHAVVVARAAAARAAARAAEDRAAAMVAAAGT